MSNLIRLIGAVLIAVFASNLILMVFTHRSAVTNGSFQWQVSIEFFLIGIALMAIASRGKSSK